MVYCKPTFLGAVLLPVVLFGALPAMAAPSTTILARPQQGRPGGPVFLSGSGFPSRRVLRVYMSCGSGPAAIKTQVVTNAWGRFVGVRVHAPTSAPKHVCFFFAGKSAGVSAGRHNARFTVIPAPRPLSHCALQICLTVQAFLVRLNSGARGNVVISGWPGAIANVTIARREGRAKHLTVRLNWKGLGTVKTTVAPGLLKGLQARVTVQLHLGRFAGGVSVPFHVMFGNR